MIQMKADVFCPFNLEALRDSDRVGRGRGVSWIERTHRTAHLGALQHVTPVKAGHIKPQFRIYQTMSLPANTANQLVLRKWCFWK